MNFFFSPSPKITEKIIITKSKKSEKFNSKYNRIILVYSADTFQCPVVIIENNLLKDHFH